MRIQDRHPKKQTDNGACPPRRAYCEVPQKVEIPRVRVADESYLQ
jgi:hypothetical protein